MVTDRIARKMRRSQHWRQRAARVRYNELHQEWSRRRRYWWHTMHPNPNLRAAFPAHPPDPNDGWWQHAIVSADPVQQQYTRNQLSQPHSGVGRHSLTLPELFAVLAS